jgi:hypothetical protein
MNDGKNSRVGLPPFIVSVIRTLSFQVSSGTVSLAIHSEIYSQESPLGIEAEQLNESTDGHSTLSPAVGSATVKIDIHTLIGLTLIKSMKLSA